MCEKKKWNKVALENFEIHFFFFYQLWIQILSDISILDIEQLKIRKFKYSKLLEKKIFLF